MIRAIAFDFGGTLFSTARMGNFTPPMFEAFVGRVVVNLKCSREEADRLFAIYMDAWRSRRERAGDLPEKELSSADLLQTALASVGAKLDSSQIVEILDLFHARESEQFVPFDKVIESLPALAASGYRLCVVSNNPWSEAIWASFRRYKIESLFEHVVVSCDVGYRKPHRQIFEVLLKKLSLPASDILFVGDSYTHDIETPKKMGLRTCLVDFEGNNKNSQRDRAGDADMFLTQFDSLIPAVAALE